MSLGTFGWEEEDHFRVEILRKFASSLQSRRSVKHRRLTNAVSGELTQVVLFT